MKAASGGIKMTKISLTIDGKTWETTVVPRCTCGKDMADLSNLSTKMKKSILKAEIDKLVDMALKEQ
jgi:hypothetical protein